MNDKKRDSSPNYLWWIVIAFLLLALSFIFDLWSEKRVTIKHPLAKPQFFTKIPVREAKIEPILIIDGYKYSCNDCHQNIEPSTVQKSFFSAHSDIVLEHGANNYCLTCHNPVNYETLIDINKKEVLFSQSHRSCLQCHGPIYRDWENGVHGRMNDFWDSSRGEVRKLTCVACHDPHQPKFKPMKPAPAPNIENYRRFLDHLTINGNFHD